MDYNDLTGMSTAELASLRRKLAKRANQRMVRLERSKSPVTGETYHAGAYDMAREYLREIGRGKRFSESINYTKTTLDGQQKLDIYRLKREILELDTFLHSKTSTISGNKEAEQKRIDTFTSEKFGFSIETVTSKGFYDFLQSQAYDYFLANSFTSEQLMDAYDIYREAGASTYKIRQGLAKYKIHMKELNANATDGKGKSASIKDMIDYINTSTGKSIAATEVLKILGD